MTIEDLKRRLRVGRRKHTDISMTLLILFLFFNLFSFLFFEIHFNALDVPGFSIVFFFIFFCWVLNSTSSIKQAIKSASK